MIEMTSSKSGCKHATHFHYLVLPPYEGALV